MEKQIGLRKQKRVFLCVLLVALTVAGCGKFTFNRESTPPTNAESAGREPENQPASNMKFGVIATKMPDFTAPAAPEKQPVVFQENGKYGYKDGNGNVLVPAKYDAANEFHRGLGAVRVDTIENGEKKLQWYDVSATGKLAEYQNADTFEEDMRFAIVAKDDKWGLANVDFKEILPNEYDYITRSPTMEPFGRPLHYALKDKQCFQLDLQNQQIYHYEPYIEENKNYVDVVDASEYNLATINGEITVNGKADYSGEFVPLCILEQIKFDLYKEQKKIASEYGKVVLGGYENTFIVQFDSQKEDDGSYLAVPSGQTIYPRPIAEETDTAAYDRVAKQFVTDRGIKNTPYEIGTVITGDFFETGKTSALIAVSSALDFREERQSDRWSMEQYRKADMAIFSAVLVLPDVKKPLKYLVVDSEIQQEEEAALFCKHLSLITAAQIYGDSTYEAVIENSYYESRDFSILPLYKK